MESPCLLQVLVNFILNLKQSMLSLQTLFISVNSILNPNNKCMWFADDSADSAGDSAFVERDHEFHGMVLADFVIIWLYPRMELIRIRQFLFDWNRNVEFSWTPLKKNIRNKCSLFLK